MIRKYILYHTSVTLAVWYVLGLLSQVDTDPTRWESHYRLNSLVIVILCNLLMIPYYIIPKDKGGYNE